MLALGLSTSTRRYALSQVRQSAITSSSLRQRHPRRTFITSAVQQLSDGFLDLAIALPYPPSLPAYTTTIVVLTVASRLVLTVPFSIWSRRRQWRAENLVVPELKKEMPQIQKQVLREMKTDGFKASTEEEIKREFAKRLQPIAKSRRKELLSKFRCTPLMTTIVPPLTQIPLFIGFSAVLNRVAQAPSVLDSESVFTLTSLAHSDPTATLPIILGLVTLANVETARWFINAGTLERERKVAEWAAARRSKGENVVEPKKIIQSSLRVLSVLRILIAAVVPGSVQVYWLTSAVFGLFQSWILEWWYSRRTDIHVRTSIPEP
ncbi:hypothetical protein CERSUDRAFT_91514 [Gelatoporia subvermispora B]|uniref:Membrane insertase YidC/Oxa/ALB C-terminal domain-containing protein n=1 Tax=Ceriporiopsis subvermispora (strain B) TaxID=914234 RepID=M2RQP1_CERS8|nr:hypothetical protein CERSUDRAFT_91514 [Gelatoporia subvermispora B]